MVLILCIEALINQYFKSIDNDVFGTIDMLGDLLLLGLWMFNVYLVLLYWNIRSLVRNGFVHLNSNLWFNGALGYQYSSMDQRLLKRAQYFYLIKQYKLDGSR
jgi:hypothetical protein